MSSPCVPRRAAPADRPLSNNSLSFSTNCLPHDAWAGGRGHASVDDDDDSFFASHHLHQLHLQQPMSLSSCDLNDSSDDVFADSSTPSDKVVYINLPHLRFHKGGSGRGAGGGRTMEGDRERGVVVVGGVGDSVENLSGDYYDDDDGAGAVDHNRTQSSSAVEEFVHWSSPRLTEENSSGGSNNRNNNHHNHHHHQHQHSNNARNVKDRSRDSTPNGGLDLRRQSSTSTLVGGEQGNNNTTTTTNTNNNNNNHSHSTTTTTTNHNHNNSHTTAATSSTPPTR